MRLESGVWRLEAGGWRLEAGGWRLEIRSFVFFLLFFFVSVFVFVCLEKMVEQSMLAKCFVLKHFRGLMNPRALFEMKA